MKTINLRDDFTTLFLWMKNLARQRIKLQLSSSYLFCKIIPKVTSSREIAAGNNTIFCLIQLWMSNQNVCIISHEKKIWSVVSMSFSQNVHKLSPILKHSLSNSLEG